MKVLFIWIDNYKGLSNLGLNFSNEYNISFNKDTNTLSIEDNEDYIEGFFGNKISNLTAIVGKNGVGKSSIISFLLNLVNGIPSEDIIILYEEAKQHKLYSIKRTEIISTTSLNIIPVLQFNNNQSLNIIYLNPHADPTSTYTEDETSKSFNGLFNLSTTHLLMVHSDNNRNNHLIQDPISERFRIFWSEELSKMIDLLIWINSNKNISNFYKIRMPEYVNLELINMEDSNISSPLNQYINSLRMSISSPIDNFLLDFFKLSIIVISQEIVNDTFGNMTDGFNYSVNKMRLRAEIETVMEIIGKMSVNDNLFTLVSDCYMKLEKSNWKRKYFALKYFISELFNYAQTTSSVSVSNHSLSIKFSQINNALIHSMMAVNTSYSQIIRISLSHQEHHISFLSSGEHSILSLFARINNLLLTSRNFLKPSFLLLLDEVELGLHPQWQKELVTYLLDFINLRFKDYNTQIIFTSHSPFVLSDIPKNCVILLDKKGDEVVVKSLPKLHNTFGMNIHELLTDSFFLQDGLMGEFARTKIHELIEDINNEKEPITADLYEGYKKHIQIIGEPFLRKKIMELLHSKPKEEDFIDDIRLEEQIKQKQEELKQLVELRRAKKQ